MGAHVHTSTGCKTHDTWWSISLFALELNGRKQKGEMAGDMPIIHRWKMSDKRGLKNLTAFLFRVSPRHNQLLKKGAPDNKLLQEGLTPILTPYRWHSAHTGSRSAIHRMQGVLTKRPALTDHLDRHNDSSLYSDVLKSKSPWAR